MTWPELSELLWAGLRETAWMVGCAALLTAVGGLLLGILLVLTDRGGLLAAPPLNALLGLIVNVGRSLPFIILLVAVIPFTRAVVGTTIGTTAAIVPLTIGAIPFYARIVETAIREVPGDVVSAAVAMGASRRQIVGKVLLREARPGLVATSPSPSSRSSATPPWPASSAAAASETSPSGTATSASRPRS
nr:hypothetical protein GCM10020092_049040 [Actinoplanes digitatis]